MKIGLLLSGMIILTIFIPSGMSFQENETIQETFPAVEVNSTLTLSGDLSVTESYVVSNGGNLTIVNATLTGSNVLPALIFLDAGSALTIRNSTLNIGNTAISTLVKGIQSTVRIYNSLFSNFADDSISLDGDIDLIIRDTEFRDNSKDAIDLDDLLTPAILTGLRIYNNGKDGLHISDSDVHVTDFLVDGTDNGQGIQLINPGKNTILDNILIKNIIAQEGIKIEDAEGSNVTFTNIVLTKIAQESIDITPDLIPHAFSDLYFDNITVYDVSDDAIQIEGTTGTIVMKNINITRTGDDGINIKTSPSTLVLSDSTISNTPENGIEIDTMVSTIIDNVTVVGNSLRGAEFVNFGSVVINNTILRNNGEEGVYSSNGESIRIDNTLIRKNKLSGIKANKIDDLIVENTKIEHNTEQGILMNSGNNLLISQSTIGDNGLSGTRSANVTQVEIRESAFTFNQKYGISATKGKNLTVTQTSVSNNTGFSEGSDGIRAESYESILLISNNITGNSGEGILIETSNFVVTKSNVIQNEKNGISVQNSADGYILNNLIESNGMSGVHIGTNASASINYNTILKNSDFGVELEDRENKIDLNYNVWDEGALDSGKGINNFKYANISYIVVNEEVKSYTPPKETNQLLTAILIVILTIGIIVAIAKIALNIRNKRIALNVTNPQVVFVTSNAGIPLAEYSFVKTQTDSVLLSGFLSAINSFSNDVVDSSKVSKSKGLEEINHQSYSILQRKQGDYQIVLIVIEVNDVIRKRMNNFSTELGSVLEKTKPDGIILDDDLHKEFVELVKTNFGDFRIEKVPSEQSQLAK